MRRPSGSKARRGLWPLASSYTSAATLIGAATIFGLATAQAEPGTITQSAEGISREVKEIFARSARAVVKIRGADKHGNLAGTGFFIDPAGTLYTAYSVGADAEDFTVEFDGKRLPARQVMADRRSGIALLKVDAATPALPIGKSEDVEVATPVLTVGFPLDLPETPSFGMIAGFDRKFLGRYFSTTHLRVNLPTQRGEAGAPLLNFKGEVIGILVSSVENGSACYALPIDAAEKIRSDFVRFGEARHGWIGINVADAGKEVEGSTAQFTDIMPGTPAADCGARPGDILLQVGQTKVHQPEDVIDASFFITAGDTVPITVLRGDQKLTFQVEAGFHPAEQRPAVIASPLSPQAMPLGLDRTP
ncbi:MAG: S1C family serine protease [Verrucomicrobiota bacterium]|nr:S1C family serine protease [Verrucomicrobiota bacterium]